jgi:CRISPR-associated protein Csm1
MEERVLNAALAGLLHDIGKVVQRGRSDPWLPAPGFEDSGQPVHATWTDYFINTYLPSAYRGAARHGAFHHWPEKSPAQDHSLSELVALADKLSAGERSDPPEKNSTKRPPQQMVTVFDRISIKNEPRQKDFYYLPLGELKLDRQQLFPNKNPLSDCVDAYATLVELLGKSAREESGDYETYLENLLSALRRYTWGIPSAYYHALPDVSLYDHARMTAALAVCLSEFEQTQIRSLLGAMRRDFEKKPEPQDAEILNQSVALLVGGDISGVQNFIYTISSKGAAKTLRGRSFYLQLLTEAVLRLVLRELEIPYTNVIYSGGGHFYLLAPLSAAKKIDILRRQITKTLLFYHGTDLYLGLGYAEIPAAGFRLGCFSEYWGKMHANLNQVKQRRYIELEDDLYSSIFDPTPHGGNKDKTCSVCGNENERVTTWDDEKGTKICPMCRSFEEIGKELPKATHLILGFGKPKPPKSGGARNVLGALGMQMEFMQDARKAFSFPKNVDLPDIERAVIWVLEDSSDLPKIDGIPACHHIRYTVKHIPMVKDKNEAELINARLSPEEKKDEPAIQGAPKTFTHLQVLAQGIPRLGVLRMDVDNAGDLFSHGFQKRASLARFSTLSFQLSLFFEGWVKKICEQHEEKVYAVYAGGDDLFLIAPWDIVPELAQTISKDLSAYAGDNPEVHLSGGMAFIHGKYPIYQAAEDAEGALDLAKSTQSGNGKNAFGFLGQAWKWKEFSEVTEQSDKLYNAVSPKSKGGMDGPQALLQLLQQLASDEAEQVKKNKGRPVWGPWMWRGDYQFTRMIERVKRTKNDPLEQALLDIQQNLRQALYQNINSWGVAARWAQLRLREK